MGQGDHSKYNILTLKIPNPVVAFLNFQNEGDLRKKFGKEIHEVVWGSGKVELPPDYWINVRKIFSFLDKSHSIMTENIVKYSSPAEVDDVKTLLTQLETNTGRLRKSFEQLLQDGVSDEERAMATSQGLSAGHEILGQFADRNGLLCNKFFITAPFLIMFGAIYKSFSTIWGKGDNQSRQRKEMELLEDTLEFYKIKCIEERLENIKMLRHQSVSYAVHDYSYEAQVRKDVAFGGMVNDFYDKRSKEQITFHDASVADPSDAEPILAGYKNSVKMEYDLLFNAVLRGHEEGTQEGAAGTSA